MATVQPLTNSICSLIPQDATGKTNMAGQRLSLPALLLPMCCHTHLSGIHHCLHTFLALTEDIRSVELFLACDWGAPGSYTNLIAH